MSGDSWVVLKRANRSIRIDGVSVVIGRSAQCQVIAGDKGVSRRHCEIMLKAGRLLVRDLGSRHGTWVDGHRVTGESPLRPGAVVMLGPKGPRYKLEGAGFDGQEIAGSLAGSRASARATVTARPDSGEVRRMTDAARAASERDRDGEQARVETRSRFVSGLVLGAITGLLLGAAALTFVDLSGWIELARDAVGR